MPRQSKNERQREIDRRIGEILRHHRETLGMSRAAVGRVADVTEHALVNYEKGKDTVSLSRIMELAEIYGISPHDIIDPVLDRTDKMLSAKHMALMNKVERVPDNMLKQLDGIVDLMLEKA